MANELHGYEVGVWFVRESTEGTTPSNAQYLNLAHKTEVKIADAPTPNPVALSGSVDNAAILKGISKPMVTLTINPSKGSAKDFMKTYASTDVSFTMLVMKDATSDTIIARIPGCKVKRMGTNTSIYPQHSPVQVSLEVWGWSIESTQSAGNPTFEEAPGTAINWSDVLLRIGSTTITDWWDAEFTIDNEIERVLDSSGDTEALKRGRRTVNGAFTRTSRTTQTGSSQFTATKNATTMDISIVIDSDVYLFDDSVFEDTDVTHSITALAGIKSTFMATSLTLPN